MGCLFLKEYPLHTRPCKDRVTFQRVLGSVYCDHCNKPKDILCMSQFLMSVRNISVWGIMFSNPYPFTSWLSQLRFFQKKEDTQTFFKTEMFLAEVPNIHPRISLIFLGNRLSWNYHCLIGKSFLKGKNSVQYLSPEKTWQES